MDHSNLAVGVPACRLPLGFSGYSGPTGVGALEFARG